MDCLDPKFNMKQGRLWWTKDNVAKLEEAVRIHGRDWARVAKEVGCGKNATQCRRKYSFLQDSKSGKMTPKERRASKASGKSTAKQTDASITTYNPESIVSCEAPTGSQTP